MVDAGIAAIGLDLPEEARRAIDDHVRLLLAWNRAINLTAITEPSQVARLHVLDSLAALGPMRERGIDRFVDIGSGGGFPGVPLAVALPAAEAALVDSIAKKTAFLETVVAAAGIDERVVVLRSRGESLSTDPAHRERWPAVTARAVTSLAGLIELAFPLLAVDGWLVAWKRGVLDDEVEAARRVLAAAGGGSIEAVPASVPSLGDHRLVLIRKESPTPAPWRRNAVVRRRRSR